MSNELVVLTDRSRIETYITDCQMKRYLNYHAYGTGIVPLTKSYHLEFGIAIHNGIALMMETLRVKGVVTKRRLDACIKVAIDGLHQKMQDKDRVFAERKYGFAEAEGTKKYYLQEMSAMLEGMMRVWYAVEYPVIRDHYDVVAVELDRRAILNKQFRLMWRADVILIKKSTGEGVVYNIKTMKEYDKRQAATRKIALQNFTEVYGTKRWLQKQIDKGKLDVKMPKVWNVRLVGLIKGWSKWNADMERFEIEGMYTRYWKKKADTTAKGPKRTAKSKWINEYGEEKGLYWQGYDRYNSWKAKGGIKGYLDLLKRGVIYPGDDAFREMIVIDGEQMITNTEIDENIQMAILVETEVQQKLKMIEHLGEINADNWPAIKTVFTTNYNKCYYMDTCGYDDFCNKGDGVKNNPFDNPIRKYERRVPHHDEG